MFGNFDANKDGALSASDLTQTFAAWFTKAGGEKTGSISEEDLRRVVGESMPGGPGGARGGNRPGGPGNSVRVNGVELDPLFAANDPNKPLISKLLAVPALRQRYLTYVRDIAERWLDWNRLGPIAQQYHDLIAADVKADTRKLDSTEDFERSLAQDIAGHGGGPGGGGTMGLKNFSDQRRAYLLRVTGDSRR
jgi:hypothetical protein